MAKLTTTPALRSLLSRAARESQASRRRTVVSSRLESSGRDVLTLEDLQAIFDRSPGELASMASVSDLTDLDREVAAAEAFGLDQISQRWEGGEARYIGPDTSADPLGERYRVELTHRRSDYAPFIEGNHYLVSTPQIRCACLLVDQWNADRVVGVATVSNSPPGAPSRSANPERPHPAYGGISADQIGTLSRLVLLDEVGQNAETYFLAGVRKHAADYWPTGGVVPGQPLRLLVSFSDPIPRVGESGVRMPGHIGNIYQAANATYLRPSPPKRMLLTPRGLSPSVRSISKILSLDSSSPERGAEGSVLSFIRVYAPDIFPLPGEQGLPVDFKSWAQRLKGRRSWRAWLESVESDSRYFEQVQHPGNLTYFWSLGDKRLRRQTEGALQGAYRYEIPWQDVVRYIFFEPDGRAVLDYPKRREQAYLSLSSRYFRSWSRGRVGEALVLADLLTLAWFALSQAERDDLLRRSQLYAPPTDQAALRRSCALNFLRRKSRRGTPNQGRVFTFPEVWSASICRLGSG